MVGGRREETHVQPPPSYSTQQPSPLDGDSLPAQTPQTADNTPVATTPIATPPGPTVDANDDADCSHNAVDKRCHPNTSFISPSSTSVKAQVNYNNLSSSLNAPAAPSSSSSSSKLFNNNKDYSNNQNNNTPSASSSSSNNNPNSVNNLSAKRSKYMGGRSAFGSDRFCL